MPVLNIPMVVKKGKGGERAYDIFSRLLEERIVFLDGEVNSDRANTIVAEFLYLESEDENKDIFFYINSPGGEITSGLAIYDTMNYIKPKVNTICIGQAASMAALLLASGTGKRWALPSSRIMIHQPLGGAQGQATEIQIQAKEISRLKEVTSKILAKATKKTLKTITKDTERDNYMDAKEALEYGIIDEIISSK